MTAQPSIPSAPAVLLVEDDPATAAAMSALMKHYGLAVRHARTILEAMPLLRDPPRFAVLDLMLPDGGGERVLDLIRKRSLAIKVAVITAVRDRDRLTAVARLHPDLMLAKPIDFIRLLAFLRGDAGVEAAAHQSRQSSVRGGQ